jgi:xanthine dehydrogenase small subunit
MVECHGSQCGFCTPGFVMSLFALYKTTSSPDPDAVRFGLAGNLCRCTGYRPILAAAERMYELGDDGMSSLDARLKEQLSAIRVTAQKRTTSAAGRYTAPTTLDELSSCFEASPNATLLAGGTDVGLWVTKQHRSLPDIIYIGQVAELSEIRQTDEHIEIGAGVSLTDAFAALLREFPELAEIARRFASPPICNSATLCGNVANGSPIGDSMPALICLGATVALRCGSQAREIDLEDLYLGYQHNSLRKGEFVSAVRVPRNRKSQIVRAYKISKRFEQDISAVCGAFCIELSAQRIESARVCFGGMAPIPKRATHCETELTGAVWSAATIDKAARALARDFVPITDLRATDRYRRQVAVNLLKRFFAEVEDADTDHTVWRYAG